MDFFEFKLRSGSAKIARLLDGASRFQKCRNVSRETTAEAIESIEKEWIRHYGIPTRLVVEECGAARSQEMLDWT
eukprot:9162909-Pyramimonas_sp.AAC.1